MQEIIIPFHILVSARTPQGYPLRATCAGRSAEVIMPPLAGATITGNELGEWLFPAPIRQLLIETAREAVDHKARMQLRLALGKRCAQQWRSVLAARDTR